MPKVKMDEEMKTFAADVLESIAQAKRGEFARVHTPTDIAAYKARGALSGASKTIPNKQLPCATAPKCWWHSALQALAGKPA